MDDMRAVLEAAGSERALVVGSEEGGQMAALYAATHPDATVGLVLFQLDSPAWAPTHAEVEAASRRHEALGDATTGRRDAGPQLPDAPAQRSRPRLVRELAPHRRQPRDRATRSTRLLTPAT